jgi:hypothetical protein
VDHINFKKKIKKNSDEKTIQTHRSKCNTNADNNVVCFFKEKKKFKMTFNIANLKVWFLVFQNVFHSEKYINNIFLFLKIIFKISTSI